MSRTSSFPIMNFNGGLLAGSFDIKFHGDHGGTMARGRCLEIGHQTMNEDGVFGMAEWDFPNPSPSSSSGNDLHGIRDAYKTPEKWIFLLVIVSEIDNDIMSKVNKMAAT